MFAKAVLVFCAQALLVKSALSQCAGRTAYTAAPALAYDGLAYNSLASPFSLAGMAYDGIAAPCGYNAIDFSPTSGGGFIVTSASPAAPTGISVVSENAYDGILAVVGELPFVGTTALEGVVPTTGAGAINHACGSGVNAMSSEGVAYAPDYAGAYSGSYAPAAANLPAYGPVANAPAAYGAGYGAGYGVGCGYIL